VLTLSAVLTLAALAAPPDTVPAEPCASHKPSKGIAAFVVVAPAARGAGSRDTMVSATVCVVPARSQAAGSARIASYHGELRFDSAAARVLRVVKPGEGMRVENTAPAGRVRFAGADPAGFAEGTLLTLHLRVAVPGTRPAIRLQMLELNGTDGRSLMPQLVTSSAAKP
jgi:hypothetical protein